MSEANIYYQDQVFDNLPLPERGTSNTQFDSCVFKNSDFTATNFTSCQFVNCSFVGCNLSMVKFGNVGFDKVDFDQCKLVGADFTPAKDFLFAVDFSNSILDYMAFMKKKNRKAKFVDCSMKGADFTESDLTSATFQNCDLSAAVFSRTVLNSVDFTSANHFTIDPERNQLRKAKFIPNGLAGLLSNYDIIVEHR